MDERLERRVKSFEELTTYELYEILRVRAEVFAVEQQIACQDMDGVDLHALHMYYEDPEGEIQAYLRMFPKRDEPGVIQIGRVLTRKPFRGTGLGLKLMKEALEYAAAEMKLTGAYIHSQEYAAGFYEKLGFKVTSEPFMEEGIIHVEMRI